MREKFGFIRQVLKLSIVVLVLTASFKMSAQKVNTNEIKDFKVAIEKTNNGYTMKSIEGSVWIELSFSLKNCQTIAINRYGMTDLNNQKIKKSKRKSYLFTIRESQSEIELKGIEGTAWTKLYFTPVNDKEIIIDSYGISKPD